MALSMSISRLVAFSNSWDRASLCGSRSARLATIGMGRSSSPEPQRASATLSKVRLERLNLRHLVFFLPQQAVLLVIVLLLISLALPLVVYRRHQRALGAHMTRSSPSLFFLSTAPLFGSEKFSTRFFLLLEVFRSDLTDQSHQFDVIPTRLLNLFFPSRAMILHHVRRLSPVPVRRARALAHAQSAGSVAGS